MEVVQGKSTSKKIIIAQEIAFAKVLAGNNKTLRDRALKKLRKWLTVRGSGRWTFTEDEFIRIWTGLFYCMWMSDKFLVQEELAENISQLIHCFKRNHESGILFIKCFHKRVLMEYEGLDQYRIDKFNLLIRRFLRQTLEYCRRTNWDKSILTRMTNIFSDVVFSRESTLGFVLHFLNIYPEELAKVGQGKIQKKTVLLLIEPCVKLLAKSKDDRIQNGVLDFFNYLMMQTDVGIEFEEKFKAWRQMGFPGNSINSIKRCPVENGHDSDVSSEESEDENYIDNFDKPLDPRAGSVHVDLPQIPLDLDSLINLLKKYERGKLTIPKSKRKIRNLIQKFSALRRGKFPARIKKDPIIDEKIKKPKQTIKNALGLMNFTRQIESEPIKSKEFASISKFLDRQYGKENEVENGDEENESDEEEEGNESLEENEIDENVEEELCETTNVSAKEKNKKKMNEEKGNDEIGKENFERVKKSPKKGKSNNSGDVEKTVEKIVETGEKSSDSHGEVKKKRKKKKLKSFENDANEIIKREGKKIKIMTRENVFNEEIKKVKKSNETSESDVTDGETISSPSKKKNGLKRKVLNDCQTRESGRNYSRNFDVEVVKLNGDSTENRENEPKIEKIDSEKKEASEREEIKSFFPAFWAKDKEKVFKTGKSQKKKKKMFANPYAEHGTDSISLGSRRISFALEKNMAQENEEYLEEVKNSPRVPFDGSKKPIQSALKSGLSPTPINPFYTFKKIKL